MKTKFDALLKVKKQDLERCELQIIKNNNLIASKYQELDGILQELGNVQVPQSGSFWDFKTTQEIKKTLVAQIDSTQNEISALKNTAQSLQVSYKQASIEYEKIKYLKESEMKKKIQILKTSESKQMDEIALMLFEGKKEKI